MKKEKTKKLDFGFLGTTYSCGRSTSHADVNLCHYDCFYLNNKMKCCYLTGMLEPLKYKDGFIRTCKKRPEERK